MPFYQPIHFDLKQLVSPDIFRIYGEQAWQFFDDRLLIAIDQLREYFDVPLTVNDWSIPGSGKKRMYCGFREKLCEVGSVCSQHRRGAAVDIACKLPAKKMRLKIIEKQVLFPYITCMEDIVPWLHIDTRMGEWKGIRLIKP